MIVDCYEILFVQNINSTKKKEVGGPWIQWYNLYVWRRQFSRLNRRKKPRKKPQQSGKDRSLCCIIWQETSTVLSDRGVRMIGRMHVHTHAHTHTQCLSFPLFSLVCFPSRDELLADRTGPLGILLSPSTADRLKGPDSYAEIPAVPGKSFPISHRIPYLGRRKKSEWGRKKGEWKTGSTPSES